MGGVGVHLSVCLSRILPPRSSYAAGNMLELSQFEHRAGNGGPYFRVPKGGPSVGRNELHGHRAPFALEGHISLLLNPLALVRVVDKGAHS